MSNPSISIDFRLTGAGWAQLEIKIGEHGILMDGVSYTTDVLGDLLRAALMITTGAWAATASFDGEPREWRLVLGNVWDSHKWREGFWVRVFEFPDIYEHQPNDKGTITFEAECNKMEFARQVLGAAKKHASEHPDYDWGHNPFPARAVAALEIALVTPDPLPSSPQTV